MTLRPKNICESCRYTWYPKGNDLARQCPSCGSEDTGFAPEPPPRSDPPPARIPWVGICGCVVCFALSLVIVTWTTLALLDDPDRKRPDGPRAKKTEKDDRPTPKGEEKPSPKTVEPPVKVAKVDPPEEKPGPTTTPRPMPPDEPERPKQAEEKKPKQPPPPEEVGILTARNQVEKWRGKRVRITTVVTSWEEYGTGVKLTITQAGDTVCVMEVDEGERKKLPSPLPAGKWKVTVEATVKGRSEGQLELSDVKVVKSGE
jgi:hypothetical protein